MQPLPTLEQLDEILALQLTLAWAGEAPGGAHPRLGWWKTDLVDADAGGDLWARLLPRTHRWAGLDAARRAARQVDQALRNETARADEMLTLFHFGFELDEGLDERLAHHKLEGHPPTAVLPLLEVTATRFDRGALLARLTDNDLDLGFKVAPSGRQLKGRPEEPETIRAHRLACAMLIDAPRTYPLPFLPLEASRGAR